MKAEEFDKFFREISSIKGRYVEFPVHAISYYPVEKQKERLNQILYNGEGPYASGIYDELQEKRMIIQLPNHVTISANDGTILESRIRLLENKGKILGELELSKLYNPDNPQLRIFLLPSEILAPSPLEIEGEIAGNSLRHTISAKDIHGSHLNIHCGENPYLRR